MDRIRRCADLSVGRGVAFGLLAVATFTVGFLGEPRLALRAAAVLLGLEAAILWLLAAIASNVNYRRREVWLLLERDHGLPEERAQEIISRVIRDTLLHYARPIAIAAMAVWAFDVIGRLLGAE